MALSAAAKLVHGVLLRLRTRAGLTVERLDATEIDTSALADLPAVRRATADGMAAGQAIVTVMADLVAELDVTDRLIADAALCLGVVGRAVGEHPAFVDFYANDLGIRRQALVDHWETLHRLLGITPPPRQMTLRSLRGSAETKAFGVLATRCVRSEPGRSQPDAQTDTQPASTPTARRAGAGPVVIVGGAVMDHIFVVSGVPALNTSANATTRDEHPGGKGLNLAVAAARMELDAALISTIGDDDNGQRVVNYLASQGLRTDLVKRVANAKTPITTMLVTEDGESSAIGWKNLPAIRRTQTEFRALTPVIKEANVVCVTFEPSFDEVRWALSTASQRTAGQVLLVQPSPPIDSVQHLYGFMPSVDYLVGSEWELRCLLPADERDVEFDEVARGLLNLGVKTICAVEQLRCRIRTAGTTIDVHAPAVPVNENPGAREAFSMALIHRIIKSGGDLSPEKLRWAAAAMAANISLEEIPKGMPEPDEVDEILGMNQILE